MPLKLEIVSPEKLLLSKDVDMVVIPASEGEIGVLPGHAPLIVMLQGGVLQLYEGATVTERFFIGGGFAEVTSDRCTVLADEAVPLAELIASDATAALQAAEQAYQTTPQIDPLQIEQLIDTLQIARARKAAAV
jgi:F-type H+-transporting ATPase subunit epsilon